MSGELAMVVVAAGSSRRMGFDKLTAPLAGTPVYLHSLLMFNAHPEVGTLVLVTQKDRLAEREKACRSAGIEKLVAVVPGGGERWESVWAGIRAVPGAFGWIGVHDGARPLITTEAVTGCFALARKFGGASCAAPVTDTLKRQRKEENCSGAKEPPVLGEGVPREGLWAMQTPQIFEAQRLREAYGVIQSAGLAVTDETSALTEAGHRVALYANPHWNPKITFPRDLALAEAILSQSPG